MENILEKDVEKLAKEFGLSEDEVRGIYQKEQEKISLSAKIKDFIPVISWKRTREKLGEFSKKK